MKTNFGQIHALNGVGEQEVNKAIDKRVTLVLIFPVGGIKSTDPTIY